MAVVKSHHGTSVKCSVIFKYDHLLLLVQNLSILLKISHSNVTQSVLVGRGFTGFNCT